MMTKQQILDALDIEKDRILAGIVNADPLSTEYHTGLSNYSGILSLEGWFLSQGTGAPAKAPAAAPAEEPTPEPAQPEPAQPEPAQPEPAQNQTSAAPTYTKAQVRKLLGEAQTQHPTLDLPSIIRSFGAQVLSDVPAERYAELLEKVNASTKELS